MKNYEWFTQATESFDKQKGHAKVGFILWEVFKTENHLKLECWNMKFADGRVQTVIVQMWSNAKGGGWMLYLPWNHIQIKEGHNKDFFYSEQLSFIPKEAEAKEG